MRLDIYLTPGEVAPADVAERTVVVIDILRASTSIVQALGSGARSIYPVSSIEEALRLANTFGRDEVLLCGERRCLPIEGFDLGNSPREFTREKVAGKTLVMSTTNGTLAMGLTTGASRVYIGSVLNGGAIVDELVRGEADPVFLCSGRERHFALEDAAFAGWMASQVMRAREGDWVLSDGARAALVLARDFGPSEAFFRTTAAGKAIVEAGLGDDLAFCAQADILDILPVYHERNITLSQTTVGSTS